MTRFIQKTTDLRDISAYNESAYIRYLLERSEGT